MDQAANYPSVNPSAQSNGLAAYGIGSAAILLIGRLLPMPLSNHTILHIPAFCPFLRLTGHPCPFCGMTRAVVCAMHGDFTDSLRYHPFGIAFCAGLVTLICLSIIQLIQPKLVQTIAALFMPYVVWRVVGVAFLIAWIVRLAGVDPLVG